MAIDRTATTAYASNRYAPRPQTGPVGRHMSPAQRDLVAKLVTERHDHHARLLQTVEPTGSITREDIDLQIAIYRDPAVIVAAIQAELNRTDVRATDRVRGDMTGLVSILLADNRAMAARVRESERKASQRNSAAPAGTFTAEDGQTYRATDGRVFHAYRTQRGVLCVKLWTPNGETDEDGRELGDFVYYGAATRMPAGAVLMTREDAAAFGKATSTCCRCMRHLTHDDSVARGMGPDCWALMGG
jgi:hypothetical protein